MALPLTLALTLADAASAQDRSWTDPPARPAAAPTAPAPIATAPIATTPAATPPDARASVRPVPVDEGLPGTAAPTAVQPREARARVAAPPPRRVADTPAAFPDAEGRAATARALARDYLAAVSGPGEAMVAAAPRFYGARVRFYGRQTTLAALIAEKRGFVRRWPERRYEPRSIRTACDADGCTVRALVAFRAASPSRGAVSRGAAELVLEVGFSGSRPVIVAETGRVLRRGAQASVSPAAASPASAPSAGIPAPPALAQPPGRA